MCLDMCLICVKYFLYQLNNCIIYTVFSNHISVCFISILMLSIEKNKCIFFILTFVKKKQELKWQNASYNGKMQSQMAECELK